MGRIKEIAKKMPVIGSVCTALHSRYVRYRLRSKSAEDIFKEIYENRVWGGNRTVSGVGSDIFPARAIIKELPGLFNEFAILSVLDIPCGDFHWMKEIDLDGIRYLGADIVDDLIQDNIARYKSRFIRFEHLNLIKNKLPKADLILCRDCLVHFSFADAIMALENICHSQSEYLLTTTFTERKNNVDIATGQWRVLNLKITPFQLDQPLKIISEECLQHDGAYKDKALGLWRIADIRQSLGLAQK